jgi:hypothetical protein
MPTYFEGGGIVIERVQRPLTCEEREYVLPLVKKIQQIELILAAAQKGDRWVNKRQKDLRLFKRQLRNYLLDREIWKATYDDERGRPRELDATRVNKVNIV